MIKAIVFDLGGVLFDLDTDACIRAFREGLGFEKIVEILDKCHQKGIIGQLECGDLSADEFRAEVLRDSRPDAVPADVDRAFCALLADFPQDKADLIRDLSKQYALYILTNNNPITMGRSHEMMEEKKQVEVFCIYNSSVGSFSGWWRQLYGESEGKGGKGLFPACVTYSTDLHSIGQFIQDGKRNMFETMLYAENSNIEMHLEVDEKDLDGLNYLAGRPLSQVNRIAVKGTAQAHADGGTPNILISYPKKSEHTLGQLFYFFEFSCGVSCYMLGVNPFDQPGVEFYKNNIFKLLERPGY